VTRTATTVRGALVAGAMTGLLLGGCAPPSIGSPSWPATPSATTASVTTPVAAPSAEVAALADAAVMTDLGRWVFYETRPIVADAAGFRGQCTDVETGQDLDAVGCWCPDDQRIVVYRHADPRLENSVVRGARDAPRRLWPHHP